MLKYSHAFNYTELDQPFHIHKLESDSQTVALSINNSHVGYYKPNPGYKYSFSKFLNIENLLELVVSGTAAEYSDAVNRSIFAEDKIIYVRNPLGETLWHDLETGLYHWKTDLRSKFFFNPYFFDSRYLWIKTFGTMPSGVKCNDQWEDSTEEKLFSSKFLEVTDTWTDGKAIDLVDPMVLEPYRYDTIGIESQFFVGAILDIPEVKNGDVLTFTTTKDTLVVEVKNCPDTNFIYAEHTVTDRPIVHVPIRVISPNELIHYAKGLPSNTTESITLNLHGTDVTFMITRT
jgi:hypothetical protein